MFDVYARPPSFASVDHVSPDEGIIDPYIRLLGHIAGHGEQL